MLTKKQDTLIHIRKRNTKPSSGERIISKFLADNDVFFYTEFFFKEMVQNKKLKLLFFDFFCPEYNLCIEFDGAQHYTGTYKGKRVSNQRTNDFLKNAFCKSKGINLLRIKYTEVGEIENIITNKFDLIKPVI